MNRMRGYRLELKLNEEQRNLCSKSAGTARYAYNWKLGKLIREYESLVALKTMYGLEKVPNIMGTAIDWHREWNRIKDDPKTEWIRETSKCCGQEALRNLQAAFKRFFKDPKKVGYPKLKKKGVNDSFRLTGSTYIGRDFVHLPGIGKVKLYEKGRVPIPSGQEEVDLKQVTVSRQAGHWFVSFLLEEQVANPLFALKEDIPPDDVIGLDLGIKSLAVTDYGETFENSKAYKHYQKNLRRYQRMVSRRKKGSKNRKKAMHKVSSLHKRVADIRTDSAHKMTTQVVKTKPRVLVIEGLKPKNMVKNKKLAGSISDAAWGKIKEQFVYKCAWNGIHLVVAPTFYPSSQLCSSCGHQYKELTLSMREWVCPCCGEHHDRDVNAARNLKAYGLWLLDMYEEKPGCLAPGCIVSFTGSLTKACPPGGSQEEATVPPSTWPRDRRLQFFSERCLSEKQEFTTYLENLRCA